MKGLLTLIIVAIVAVGGFYFFTTNVKEAQPVDLGSGNVSEKRDLIRVTSPLPGDEISSPVSIVGEARGYWFFEASFPITVVDWNGQIIGQGIATAQGEWMTEDFVPFTASITYDKTKIQNNYSNRGSLILQKDNPSGLPEHDDALEFPVILK